MPLRPSAQGTRSQPNHKMPRVAAAERTNTTRCLLVASMFMRVWGSLSGTGFFTTRLLRAKRGC